MGPVVLKGAGGQLLALSRLRGTEKRIQAEDILGMAAFNRTGPSGQNHRD